MRRTKPQIALKAQGYHRFAWIVLGLAALVALTGNETVPEPGQSARPAAVQAAATGPVSRLTIKAVPADVSPAMEQDQDQELALPGADEGTSEEPPPIPDRVHPSLPGEKPAARPATAAVPVRPSPDQIGRLLAGSRARSGGVDQGDEPRRKT